MGAPRSFPFETAVPPAPLAGLLEPLEQAGLLAAPVANAASILVHRLADDSRAVTPGTLFVARSGDFSDGHLFLDKAVQNGAVAAVVSAEWHRGRPNSFGLAATATSPLGKGERLPGAACAFVPVTDTRAALGELANVFYGAPSRHLDLLGVTGTNGKTTTAFLLYRLLTALGVKTGLVGTVENRIGERRVETIYTTPEAIELNALLRAMADDGCGACAMEVSSHGLALDRVRGQRFRAGVFTNLTLDHLDFHETFEHYRASKKKLFDGLDAGAVAVVNRDDEAWAAMVADTAAPVVTYGTDPQANVRVEVRQNALDGLRLRLDGVPGRFETVRSPDGVLGVVDYAHTPDALENILRTARGMMGEGRSLWAVFGCGGDRDRTKRPVMGRIAEELADRVVLTNDNPRTEDPEAILAEIRAGLDQPGEATTIPDRAEAIAWAAAHAAPGDVVVVAGKGHEDYQIVGAEKRPFDDRRELRAAFERRAG